MVAEMTSFGTSNHFEERNGDISPPDQKDNLTENENSSSEESSEEEDSEEGPTENGSQEDEHDSEDSSQEKDASPKPNEDGQKEEDSFPVPCCDKCKAIQNHSCDSVTPRKISRGRLLLKLEDEGTYRCSVTGLVFEVSQRVQVTYSVLSWSKFGKYLGDSWKFAGPIFDVDCDPAILKSIQFPHSLCLADPGHEVTFSVLHVKASGPSIEPSAEHSGSHIKWNVTSLSPVGPIMQAPQLTEHHGIVLVYKEVRQTNSFRIYLAANNHSDVKDIQKEVRSSKKKFVKVEKPPTCLRLLVGNNKYKLISEPEAEINPEEFPFTLAVVKIKGYFEVIFDQSPPFKLSLVEADSGETVWTATLRQGDCEDNVIEEPRKRTESRKRSNSTSEEDNFSKRTKMADVPDGVRNTKLPDLTDQQLMMVAKQMGKEWKQVAIGYLGLTMQDLDEIKDEDLTMHKFRMLDRWRRRTKGEASASHLYRSLDHEDVPNEVRDTLEDMVSNIPSK